MDIQKQIEEATEFYKEYKCFPASTNPERVFEWLKHQQSIIPQQNEQISELLRVNSVKSTELLEKDNLISQQSAEIERLRNMIEIVLYHHPNIDEPIDYETAYDNLKKQIDAEYEKSPWIDVCKDVLF